MVPKIKSLSFFSAPRFASYEVYLHSVMKGQRLGFGPSLLKMGLLALSYAYRACVNVRNACYNRRWIKSFRLSEVAVISVGNLVAGGTGKTPFTLMLAKELQKKCAVAILSRGYRSAAEKKPFPALLQKGEGCDPQIYGDEPCLLAQNLPGLPIYVGRKRCLAARLAKEAGARILILDDGLQHRQLARDFDVVMVDALNPLGEGYCLPRGFLREPPKGLSRAQLIVLNHVQDHAHFMQTQAALQPYTSAAFIGVQARLGGVNRLDSQGSESLESWHGKKIGVFCGLAQPLHFLRALKSHGLHIVAQHMAADHMAVDAKQLSILADEAKKQGAEMLLCTEKDYLKLKCPLTCPLPIAWVPMSLVVVEGQAVWQAFLAKVIVGQVDQ